MLAGDELEAEELDEPELLESADFAPDEPPEVPEAEELDDDFAGAFLASARESVR